MGVEVERYDALRRLVLGETVDVQTSGIYPWRKRGSDNQAALAIACGLWAGMPGAREAAWAWYAAELEGHPGLFHNEPLSRPYHHFHWAAGQAVRLWAWQHNDPHLLTLLDLWSRAYLDALALLAVEDKGWILSEAPCARASWDTSVHASLALEEALGAPLLKTKGPFLEWQGAKARSLGLGCQQRLAAAGRPIFSEELAAAWRAWIHGRKGSPPSTRVPLASPVEVWIYGDGSLLAWMAQLDSYDTPQPAVLLLPGGEVRRLRPATGNIWPKGATVTRLEGDRLVARAPLGGGQTWVGELVLPGAAVGRRFRLEGSFEVGETPAAPEPGTSPPPPQPGEGATVAPARIAYALRRAADQVDGGDLQAARVSAGRAVAWLG